MPGELRSWRTKATRSQSGGGKLPNGSFHLEVGLTTWKLGSPEKNNGVLLWKMGSLGPADESRAPGGEVTDKVYLHSAVVQLHIKLTDSQKIISNLIKIMHVCIIL